MVQCYSKQQCTHTRDPRRRRGCVCCTPFAAGTVAHCWAAFALREKAHKKMLNGNFWLERLKRVAITAPQAACVDVLFAVSATFAMAKERTQGLCHVCMGKRAFENKTARISSCRLRQRRRLHQRLRQHHPFMGMHVLSLLTQGIR